MKKNVKSQKEADGRNDEMRQTAWLELRRHAFQCQTKWKTTLFQAELVLLTVGLPLALGSVSGGPARYGILLSALSACVSLMFGTRSLIQEACSLRDMESRERHRIQSGEREDQEDVPAGIASSLSTAIFVSSSCVSFLSLYLFVGYADLFNAANSLLKRLF